MFVKDFNISMRPVVFVSSYEHHSNLLPWYSYPYIIVCVVAETYLQYISVSVGAKAQQM